MNPLENVETRRVTEIDPEVRIRKMSRRGFAWAGVAAISGYGAFRWLGSQEAADGLSLPLRRVLDFNEGVARRAFDPSRLSPNFPRHKAREPRVNGVIGLSEVDLDAWRLNVVGAAGDSAAKSLSLAEIKKLPRIEMTTELRCVEGWSEVVHWAGARLADLAAVTGFDSKGGSPHAADARVDDRFRYVGMSTPDGAYYVGLDVESALHPQTLLCYEMNGAPLTHGHGAPLRLAIPVKYGIKNLKQIGTIRFTDQRPADYWAKQGYDWYAGH